MELPVSVPKGESEMSPDTKITQKTGTSPEGGERCLSIEKDGMKLVLENGEVRLFITGTLRPQVQEAALFLRSAGCECSPEFLTGFLKSGEKSVSLGGAPSSPADGTVEVRISKDSSSAEVVLGKPGLGGRYLAPEDVLEAMGRKGIVHGIRNDAIEEACKEKIFDEVILVAEGTPPQHGLDAIIEITAPLQRGGKPAEDEHGNVNLRDLGVVNSVAAGQILAVKTPPTEGVEGKTVRGTPVKAKNGKDRPFPSGSGTAPSEDGLSLLASIDGHLVEMNGRLHVLPVFQVEGDVNYSVGNIDFTGTVVVNGAVRDGFEVRAGSDITVNGMVEGAFLHASRDIVISGGVRGTGKGRIEAGRNIRTGFADQSCLKADGDIEIKNALLHSDVRCGGRLSVLGGQKSQIAGGKVQAGQEVVCLTLGSEMGTKTEVFVGVLADKIDRKQELERQIDIDENNLRKIEANIRFLKKLEESGQMTQDKRKLMIEFTRASFTLQSSLKDKQAEIASIDILAEKSRTKSVVRVKGVCYPGVVVSMRGVFYKVREQQKFCSFRYDDGEIKVFPFDG